MRPLSLGLHGWTHNNAAATMTRDSALDQKKIALVVYTHDL
jgi:hypothetical protein